MLFLLSSVLAAPPMAQLNGSWTLDRRASESISDILAVQGLSWIERTLAESGSPTHVIELHDDRYVVQVSSGWYRRTDVLPLDGFARPVDYARIGEVQVRSERRDQALYTEATLTLRDGSLGTVSSTRRLVDPDTLELLLVLERPSAAPLTARRVFRRDPS